MWGPTKYYYFTSKVHSDVVCNIHCRAGLHNSESSKGQIDQHKLTVGCKSLFRGSVEEILNGQVIIRSRAFATFSATEFSRAACGPRAICCAGLL